MELKENKLYLDRETSSLDKEVIEFTNILDKIRVDYSIVSGYVAILTGRSRGTEDIDLVIRELSRDDINSLVKILEKNDYWCINTELEAIYDMLSDQLSVRVAKKDNVIPNFELFFAQDQYDKTALKDSIKAQIDGSIINISPIELQIAYKLHLGAEKDLEDALHLYEVFKAELDMGVLKNLVNKMGVGDEFDRLKS